MNTLYLRCGLVLVLMLGAGAVAWLWQANAYRAVIARDEAAHQADLALIADAAAKQSRQALEKQQAAEQKLSAIDNKATEEKAYALAENEALRKQYSGIQATNDRLRADVVAGYDRLRLAGSCRPAGSGVSGSTVGTGLGDAGTVELSAAAGSRVFDIRAGIIADQAALRALQAYVSDVCLAH